MFHSCPSRMVLRPPKGTVGRLSSTTVAWSCSFGTDQPTHVDAVTKNPPLGATPGNKPWGIDPRLVLLQEKNTDIYLLPSRAP